MISVIIPAFNAEKNIKKCLNSLEHQTLSRDKYELLVVDDGSTDRTGELVKKYPEVKYYNKTNAGPASARNFGAQKAAGDILLFIDADCEAANDWIDKMMMPFSDSSIAAVKGVYQTKQKRLITRLIQLEFEERYSKMARSKGLDFMDFSAGAVRKEIFNKLGGFEESLKMSEDVQFSYKLTDAGHKIVFVESGIVFHQHPSNIRNYLKVKFWRSYWRMDVYKNYPKKILRDSYTPQTLKMQILTLFIFLLTLVLLPVIPFVKYFLFAELALFVVWIAPLTWRALKNSILAGILMPFFLIGRAFSLGLGVLYYFLEIKNFRELISFILLALVIVVPSLFTGGRDLIARVFVFVLAFPILFFVIRADKKPLNIKIPWRFNIILPLFIFFGILLASIFFSASPYDSYYGFLHWLSYGILFMAVIFFVSKPEEGHKFSYLIILLASILSIIALYFFSITEFYNYLRAISTFYQHNPFAGFLLFALPLSMSYLFFDNNKKRKIILLFITILLSLTFVLTHSRGAWLSFVLPFMIILFFAFKHVQKKLRELLLLGIIVVAVGAGWWGMDQLKQHQANVVAEEGQQSVSVGYSIETPEENAVTARLHFWQGAGNMFLDNPVFGTGFETYRTVYRQYLEDIRYYTIDPHNVYLKVLAELGIIGASVFYWFVAIIIVMILYSLKLISKIEKKSDKALLLGLGMGLLGSLSHSLVELDWQFPTNLIVFFVVLGIFYKVFLIQGNKYLWKKNPQTENLIYSKASKIIFSCLAFIVMIGGVLIFLSNSLLEEANFSIDNYELDRAEISLNTAIRLDPLNYNLYNSLANYYYIMVPKDVEHYKALFIQELERTIKYSKNNYAPYERLARHYLLSKDYRKAEELYDKAIELNPVNKPGLHLSLAVLYFEEERYDEVIKTLEKVTANYDPNIVNSVVWQAVDRQKILDDIAYLHNVLGLVYQKQGIIGKAEDNLNKGLEYSPGNQLIQKNLEKLLFEKKN